MTAFSYLMSWIRSSQFKEPELLDILISRATSIPLNPGKRRILGWLIHYSIGCFFVFCFHLIWYNSEFQVSILTGAALGFLFGIIGISGWRIFFYLNADPPRIRFQKFYLQLLFAHVLFGITAAGTVLLLNIK